MFELFKELVVKNKIQDSEPLTKIKKLSKDTIRRRKTHSEQKIEIILSAALDIFSRYGLHGASMEQIALQADVSKTNLFYYFNSKEALYFSVLQRVLTLWLKPLVEFSIEQDPIVALKGYIKHKLSFSRDHQAESRLFCIEMLQEAPILRPELESSLRELVNNKTKIIEEWIKQKRLRPINPRHLLFTIWATTQHYADFSIQVEVLTGKNLSDPEFFNETLEALYQIILKNITVE